MVSFLTEKFEAKYFFKKTLYYVQKLLILRKSTCYYHILIYTEIYYDLWHKFIKSADFILFKLPN